MGELGWVRIVRRPGREVWRDVGRRREWEKLGEVVVGRGTEEVGGKI